MRKILMFFLFFTYSITVFADDDNFLLIDNILGSDKIKITLLKPCVVVKEEIKNENNDSSTVAEKQSLNNVDNIKERIDNKKNNTIESFLDDLNDKDNDNIENKEEKDKNNKKNIVKLVWQDYFDVDPATKIDKVNSDKEKFNKIIDNIYKKIMDNLEIINLYNIDYRSNSCRDMNEFFKNTQDRNNINDYIFSDNFIDSDFIVSAEIEKLNETEVKIQILIWDILDEKFLDGKYYILHLDNKNNNSYRISNMISDFIFKITTGEKEGLFDSKIMYISETGSPLKREKQVAIMNFDGSKNVKITKSKNLKLIPIFSKYNPNEIFYMEYLPEGPFIVKYNLADNSFTKILTKNQTMTSAANFNPDNKNQLILAGTSGKSTNLFLFDFKEKKNKQITKGNSINTAPSFSPDGKKIVYVSDKSGVRKLYIKDLENNKEELLTKEAGVYDKPSWSPDGKLIAFVKIKGQQFELGIMNYRGEAERILTSSYLIEGVKWSPNSRYLIYTKQKGAYGTNSIPRIYIKDILTGNEYRIQTPPQEGASDPDWVMNK